MGSVTTFLPIISHVCARAVSTAGLGTISDRTKTRVTRICAIVPDVLIQPHSASLQMMYHTGRQFPAEYKGNIFVAQHGSWNRAKPTGYKVTAANTKIS